MTKPPAKSPQAFRTIGEVARLVGVATHVLRYWESQFPALSPVKRPDGRRYYRPEDVQLAAGLCAVMREDGLTIRGANLLISKDKGAALRARGRARLGEETVEGAAGTGGRRPADAQAGRSGTGAARGRAAAETAAETAEARADGAPRRAQRQGARGQDSGVLPLFPDLFASVEAGDEDAAQLVEPVGETRPAAVAEAARATSDSAPCPGGRNGDQAVTGRADSPQPMRPPAAGAEPHIAEPHIHVQAEHDPRGAALDPRPHSDGSTLWLARLTATAAALRTRRAPLPESAAALAAALRLAHEPC